MLTAIQKIDIPRAGAAGVVLIALGFGLWATLAFNAGLYFLAGIAGAAVAVLSFRSQIFWMYTIAAATSVFFRTSDVGVSILDVIIGAYYIGGLGIWLFTAVFVRRTRIILHIGDWFFMFFFIALLGVVVVSFMNGVGLMDAVSEYLLFSTLLLYFPARDIFKDKKKEFALFLAFFAVVVFYHDLQQFYDYFFGIRKGIKYVYEMLYSVRINQTLYTASCLISLLFVFYVKKRSQKLLLLVFFSTTVVALITSFSRTFWIILIAEIFIVALYLPARQKVKLAIFTGAAATMMTLATLIFAPQYAETVFNILEYRLSSSTEGKKDISVLGRIAEYNEVIDRIKDLPMGGNGLRKKFSYMDPLSDSMQHKHIIHNGYLFIVYRMGFPIAFLFLFVVVYFTVKSEKLARKVQDPFYKNIAISAFLIMILLLIANFTSSQYFYRDGMFVTLFGFAFTEIAAKQYAREQEEKALAKVQEN
ncbi:MAG: O-antigen ligase family protein [Chloroflexota bacterium]